MDIKKNILRKLIKTDEDMIYIVSHHYIAYFWTITILLIGIVIVFSLYKLIWIFSQNIASLVAWILWIIVYINFILNFFDVYLDAVVITNRSLIIYKWYWLLKNSIDVIANHAVESVYSDQNGMIDTIFNKWDLFIKTARDKTIFRWVMDSWEVANDINKIIFSLTNKNEEVEWEEILEFEEKKWWDLDIFMKAMEEVIKEYKSKQWDE